MTKDSCSAGAPEIEITPEMIELGAEAARLHVEIWPPDRDRDLVIEVYQAMYSHRPSASLPPKRYSHAKPKRPHVPT